MSASLRVAAAGPLVTLQDDGRFGRLRFGVPASGPMDRFAHAAANVAVGNDPDATAVEISIGGLQIENGPEPMTIAIAGGGTIIEHDRDELDAWRVVTLEPGDRVTVQAGEWGSWAYLAVAGDIVADRWLGSSATHVMSGIGGGIVRAGQQLPVADARVHRERDGSFAQHAPRRSSAPISVVLASQLRHFADDAAARLLSSTFEISDSYDRMGARLDGPLLALGDALSIASEPIVRGSIQVAGDGVPTVLLADHQTTGGYPKIATMISCDLDRFAQHRPGDSVRFEAVEPSDAVAIVRADARDRTKAIAAIGQPGRNITARLLDSDLIGHDAAISFAPDPGDP